MRRLRTSNEPAFLDRTALAHWRCDVSTSAATLPDSAYSATFHLVRQGPSTEVSADESLFYDSSIASAGTNAYGSLLLRDDPAWFQGAASSASAYLSAASAWSIAMWVLPANGGTTCFLEYSNRETIAASDQEMLIGLYRNADGQITYGWDRGTACLHFRQTGASIGPERFHLGLVREVTPSCNTNWRTSLYINGVLRDQHDIGPFSTDGSSSIFVIGASKRFGTGSGASPAFCGPSGPNRWWDDIVFLKEPLHQKVRSLYRDGFRQWDERRLLDSGSTTGRARVLVEDGDGVFVNLSELYGTDFVQKVTVSDDIEQPSKTASVTLLRARGERLNLSPLDQEAVLNLNAAGAFESLIDFRRKVRIEAVAYPRDIPVEGWMFETLFEGFIDTLSWSGETVEVGCVDRMAALSDQYQMDPRQYAYGEASTTLAETHMQTLVDNNIPALKRPGFTSTLTFGYTGGTPVIYTPASSAWALRYDDSPSGDVASLLRGIADQIGWRIRYEFYEPWHTDRLTFRRPNRTQTLDVSTVTQDHLGRSIVATRIEHDLTVGQKVTVGGTSSNNFTSRSVEEVLSARSFRADFSAGAGVSTSGTVGYEPSYSFTNQVRSYDRVEKDTQSIRNAVTIKYARSNSAVTFPFTTVRNDSADVVHVEFSGSSPGIADSWREMIPEGTAFTIHGSAVTKYNRSWTFAQISNGDVISLEVPSPSAATTDSPANGVIESSYIRARQVTGLSTPSITKYGFRPCAIYEESNGNIDTEREAETLAAAILSDLAEPTTAVQVTLPFCPWFEPDDVIRLGEDVKRRWSGNLDCTVVATEHTFSGECSTKLTLRNSVPTNGVAWAHRLMVNQIQPAIPGHLFPDYGGLVGALNGNHGLQIGGWVRPQYLRPGGKRKLRTLMTEVHIGDTPTFIADDSTLAAQGFGSVIGSPFDSDGNALSPGSTYYVRFRERDVFGNPANFIDAGITTASSFVPRFNDKGAGALAHCVNGHSLEFWAGQWSSFPFNTEDFDSYGNFNLFTPTATTLPAMKDGATSAFFQFPANGTAYVDCRLGVRNSGASKTNTDVAFGLFRLGSTRHGSNASRPFVAKFGGPSEATPNFNVSTPLFVGTAITSLFVQMTGVISGNSGDYLHAGVLPDWSATAVGSPGNSGVYPARAAGLTSVSSSWIKVTFLQD